MTGNVVLINKETFLYTNHGTYNLETKIANYTDSGRIVNKENTLKSKKGTYYAAEDLIFFKDDVEITTPDYYITSDTMQYNTEAKSSISGVLLIWRRQSARLLRIWVVRYKKRHWNNVEERYGR